MDFKKWFAEERARALALVLLTRRNDLAVEETKEGSSLDFIVSIGPAEDHGGRRFGVILKAAMSPVTMEQANEHLRTTLARARTLRDVNYPICVFYFTARDDQGYCTWVYEPAVAGKRQPKLKYHSHSDCVRLDDRSLAETVFAVDKWYDAFKTMLAS